MALELGPAGKGDVLLFAGDAQVGNWESWQSLRWPEANPTVTGPDLLARTILLQGRSSRQPQRQIADGLVLFFASFLAHSLIVKTALRAHQVNVRSRHLRKSHPFSLPTSAIELLIVRAL